MPEIPRNQGEIEDINKEKLKSWALLVENFLKSAEQPIPYDRFAGEEGSIIFVLSYPDKFASGSFGEIRIFVENNLLTISFSSRKVKKHSATTSNEPVFSRTNIEDFFRQINVQLERLVWQKKPKTNPESGKN